MTIRDIFDIDDKFFTGVPLAAEYWYNVSNQATNITRRKNSNEGNHVLDKRRPNESQEILEYRVDNERQLPRAGFDMFLSKLSRIIHNSQIRQSGFSEDLSDWLNTKPFTYIGQGLDLDSFTLDCLLKESLENTNQLLVAFPYQPSRPDVPPALPLSEGGHDPSEPIGIMVKVIPHDKLTFANNDVFVYEAGKIPVTRGNITIEQTYYIGADENEWIWFEPYYSTDSRGEQLKYRIRTWYVHNTGQSLVNFLPGEKSSSVDGAIHYLESYIRSYYDICDEVMGAFSDNQAVRLKYSHPLVAMKPTSCWNTNCIDGYIDGKRDSSKANHNKCGICHGKGEVHLPGPYGVITKDKANMMSNDDVRDPVVEFFHPDLGFAQHSFEVPFHLWKLAKQTIGLDLLDGSGVESGKAKDLRLEDLHDKINRIAKGVYKGTLERFLYQVEALLQPNVSLRSEPKFILPENWNIKDVETLKVEAENALFEDKMQAKLNYYSNKYKDQPEVVRMYEIALAYSPMLNYTKEEIQVCLASGAYDSKDLIKRDFAVIALRDIMKTTELLTLDDIQAFNLIDAYIDKRGLTPTEVPLIDED